MSGLQVGDPVRVDIPDETDPDHNAYHRRRGRIIDVLEDDAGSETGDSRDALIYRVRFDNEGEADFRWRDLRPGQNDL